MRSGFIVIFALIMSICFFAGPAGAIPVVDKGDSVVTPDIAPAILNDADMATPYRILNPGSVLKFIPSSIQAKINNVNNIQIQQIAGNSAPQGQPLKCVMPCGLLTTNMI